MSIFHLKNEDENFKSRANDIFASFDSIKCQVQEENLKSVQKRPNSCNNHLTKSIPSFKTEPHKWTKYSLESVIASDDRQNTQTALAFLHKLSKQKNYPEKNPDGSLKVNHIDVSSSAISSKEKEIDSSKPYVCFKKPSVVVKHEHVPRLKSKKVNLRKEHQENNGEKTKVSFDKVELHHLEENASAIEYQAIIEAKLDESLLLHKIDTSSTTSENNKQNQIFKSQKTSKIKKILRKRDLTTS